MYWSNLISCLHDVQSLDICMKKFYCQNNFCGIKTVTLRGVFNKHCLLSLFSSPEPKAHR